MAVEERTVEQMFEELIRPRPVADRLRLAALIMQEFAGPTPEPLPLELRFPGYSDAWTEEDMREASAASAAYIVEQMGDDDA